MKTYSLEQMKEWLIINILDKDNIGWMSDKEIKDTFEKYFDGRFE